MIACQDRSTCTTKPVGIGDSMQLMFVCPLPCGSVKQFVELLHVDGGRDTDLTCNSLNTFVVITNAHLSMWECLVPLVCLSTHLPILFLSGVEFGIFVVEANRIVIV